MPLDHEELCVEPALVHVFVVRPAERGASGGARSGVPAPAESRQLLSCMSSCCQSYLRSTSSEIGLHGLAGVRCARDDRGLLAAWRRAQPASFSQLCFTVGIPVVVTVFLFFWHAVRASCLSFYGIGIDYACAHLLYARRGWGNLACCVPPSLGRSSSMALPPCASSK